MIELEEMEMFILLPKTDEKAYKVAGDIFKEYYEKITGKKLEIKQHGSSAYSLCYEIKEGYPTGSLSFKDKKMLHIWGIFLFAKTPFYMACID